MRAMSTQPTDVVELAFPPVRTESRTRPSEVERTVIQLFDQFQIPLLRYTVSLGLPVHDGEEVTQEVFLALFRHLKQGKSRENLRGWVFRVAHNLALKQLVSNRKAKVSLDADTMIAEQHADCAPNPEEQAANGQRT